MTFFDCAVWALVNLIAALDAVSMQFFLTVSVVWLAFQFVPPLLITVGNVSSSSHRVNFEFCTCWPLALLSTNTTLHFTVIWTTHRYTTPLHHCLDSLESLSDIKRWMSKKFLHLTDSKSENCSFQGTWLFEYTLKSIGETFVKPAVKKELSTLMSVKTLASRLKALCNHVLCSWELFGKSNHCCSQGHSCIYSFSLRLL